MSYCTCKEPRIKAVTYTNGTIRMCCEKCEEELSDPYEHPGVPDSFCKCPKPTTTKTFITNGVPSYLCIPCGKFLKKEHVMPERLSDENLQRTQLVGDALEGKRGQDQKLIAEIGVAWIDTLLRKNMDYGSSVFQEPILCPGLPTTTAIDVRMSDKIARIKNLKTAKAQVADESVDDTYDDLGAYCLLLK